MPAPQVLQAAQVPGRLRPVRLKASGVVMPRSRFRRCQPAGTGRPRVVGRHNKVVRVAHTVCIVRAGLAACVCGLLAVSPPIASGQIQDTGLWLGGFSQGGFQLPALEDTAARWWFDANVRYLGDDFELFQTVIRPGLGYQLNEEQSVWLGYAWIGEDIPDLRFHENRMWEQWLLTQNWGDTNVVIRSRLEQRWVSLGTQAGWRFRQMVRVQRPVAGNPDLLWVAWDEVFFHLNDTDWGARTGYNQNRLFIGLGRRPRPSSRRRTEVGYLYQQINVAEDGADLSNHILSINIFYNP
jgi:hypothetical protein